jgi:hypothetical protein
MVLQQLKEMEMRLSNMARFLMLWLILVYQGFWAGPVQAVQLFIWTGNGDGTEWNDRFNWNPNDRYPNQDGDIAQIGGGVNVTVLASPLASELHLDGTSTVLIPNSQTLKLSSSTGEVAVFNSGTINIDAGASTNAAALDCQGSRVTLQGSGRVLLGGTKYNILRNSLAGGRFVNAAGHTIQGGGRITAPLFNQGQVLADNGALALENDVYNTGGSLLVSGSGNILDLYSIVSGGNINPQDGVVNLNNASCQNINLGSGQLVVRYSSDWFGNSSLATGAQLTVDTGMSLFLQDSSGEFSAPNTLTNAGVILLIDGSMLYNYQHTTLTGPGRVVLGGGTAYFGGSYLEGPAYTNDTAHTIEGGGQIEATIFNKGAIKANNGTLEISYNRITGNGVIQVFDNATLNVYHADVQTGDFSMTNLANFVVSHGYDGGSLDLQRNFTFSQTDPAKWTWGIDTYMQCSGGGPWQSLEVGGQDWGAANTGFSNNFNLPKLVVTGAGTRAYLVDNIDNGHRVDGKREALYVDELQVTLGATLNLNGRSLYTKLGGQNHKVVAGEGALFGGGQIINQIPGAGPATDLLLLGN